MGRVTNQSSGTITNAIPLFAASVTNTGGGTVGTVYGLLVDTQTVGGTNWAIYTNGTTPSSFGGNLNVRAGSGFSATEGTSPSASAGTDLCYGDSTAHALKCSYNNGTFYNVPQVIGSGTAAMTTALIGAGACGTTVTVAATGVATTDIINTSSNASVGANPGVLILQKWPTANNVNFAYCNPTAAGVTPSAMTINWQVTR